MRIAQNQPKHLVFVYVFFGTSKYQHIICEIRKEKQTIAEENYKQTVTNGNITLMPSNEMRENSISRSIQENSNNNKNQICTQKSNGRQRKV